MIFNSSIRIWWIFSRGWRFRDNDIWKQFRDKRIQTNSRCLFVPVCLSTKESVRFTNVYWLINETLCDGAITVISSRLIEIPQYLASKTKKQLKFSEWTCYFHTKQTEWKTWQDSENTPEQNKDSLWLQSWHVNRQKTGAPPSSPVNLVL